MTGNYSRTSDSTENTLRIVKAEIDGATARIEDENRNGEGEVGTWVDDDE